MSKVDLNVPCIPYHHGHGMRQVGQLNPRKSLPVHGEFLRMQERPLSTRRVVGLNLTTNLFCLAIVIETPPVTQN